MHRKTVPPRRAHAAGGRSFCRVHSRNTGRHRRPVVGKDDTVMPRPGFKIGGTTLAPGERRTVELPVSVLSDHTPVTMSV